MATTDLSGKVVLITGGARGIGAHTAKTLAARGARVALLDLDAEQLRETAAELGEQHAWFEADVTDIDSVEAAVNGTVARFGGIDVVIANAGLSNIGTVRTTEPSAFLRTVDVNLNGVFRTVRAALPHIVERKGYILVVSSLSAFAPIGGMAAYTASKAGSEAFASALSSEVDHLGVTVGSAHPSWIDTALVREVGDDLKTFHDMRKKLPWPMSAITTVEKCSRALADGVQRRARRIYVPRSIMLMHWLRNVTSARLTQGLMRGTLARLIPQMEREVSTLGRSLSQRYEKLQHRNGR